MSYLKNAARQALTVLEAVVSFADLTTAVALPIIDIPGGAIIDEVYLVLDETFDPTTSAVVEIGIGGTTNKFVTSQNIFTGQTLGYRAGATTAARGYKFTAGDTLDALYTSGGGQATQGSFRVIVKYFEENRADFSQR